MNRCQTKYRVQRGELRLTGVTGVNSSGIGGAGVYPALVTSL
jgi:hypothetical protein